METSSFSRMSSCHVLFALGTPVIALTCLYWMGVDDNCRISATLGLGFGQLSWLAIWCITGVSQARYWLSAVAVLGCYLSVSIWIVIQGHHINGSFYVSLAIFSILYFVAMAAAMVVVKKLRRISVVRLTDIRVSEEFSGQYGIRDIMITMSIAAIATAAIKFLSAHDFAHDLLKMLTVFGLISISFFLMSWPVVASCLSRRWLLQATFTVLLIAVIILVQEPLFTSILGSFGDFTFFTFLYIPFVMSVALHALIARWFGYRLTTLSSFA